jgi:hypothetical protein
MLVLDFAWTLHGLPCPLLTPLPRATADSPVQVASDAVNVNVH